MKVTVRGIGDMSEYLGKTPRPVDLPPNARMRDLLVVIESEWGAQMPAHLWDFEQHKFRGPVMLVVNKKAVMDIDARLVDGCEVSVMRAVAGG